MWISKPILLAVLMCCTATHAVAQTWTVAGTGQTIYAFGNGGVGAGELSGLAWAGGSQYYAVSDNGGNMFPLTINLEPNTGQVVSTTFAPAVPLTGGIDVEGIAYDAMSSSVIISDETGPALRKHSIVDGSLVQTVVVPPVFAAHRANLSLESLSLQSDGSALWTANEEALSVDGPVSSFSAGTVVRLQKFDAALNPVGQWAYVTDPIHGDIGDNGRDIEVSGVSDLLALPNGDLLVLERALGATPFGFRMRLYIVGFDGATDISTLPALVGQTYTPTSKTLVWQVNFSGFNLEGIVMGPQLANGAYSLLLVSDNGSSLGQGLHALTIMPPVCTPTPLPGCRTSEHSNLRFRRVNGERDRLTWNWRGATVETLGVYGNPLTPGGTVYSLCVYDAVGGAPSFAWGARIQPGTGWSDAGERGFRYREKTGIADGVTNIQLRTGDGNARVGVRGKGLELQPPDNGAGNPMLNFDTTVTVQLVNMTECFTATYTEAQESTADQFKARY